MSQDVFWTRSNGENINPSAVPLVTDSKRSIIANSRPILIQELEAMREEGHSLMVSDLFSLQEMRDEIARRMNNRTPGFRSSKQRRRLWARSLLKDKPVFPMGTVFVSGRGGMSTIGERRLRKIYARLTSI
jgi:hypothetical protein